MWPFTAPRYVIVRRPNDIERQSLHLLGEINKKLSALLPGPAVKLSFTYERAPMPQNLADTDQITVTLTADDIHKHHGATGLDGPPTWSVDDPSTGTVKPADDGMSAVLSCTPGGQGSQFVWTATTTSGGGAKQLSTSDTILVGAGPVDSLGYSYGDPSPVPTS